MEVEAKNLKPGNKLFTGVTIVGVTHYPMHREVFICGYVLIQYVGEDGMVHCTIEKPTKVFDVTP